MLEREPSRTAFAAAAHRAAHQVLEEGRIFRDPFALKILGLTAEQVADHANSRPASAGMRFFIACRSAFAEASLAEGVETRGVTQLVLLGAGLDTFSLRNPLGGEIKVFEVDHPATQAWKRRRLQEAGLPVPPAVVFAPVDFERERLSEGLSAAGFDASRRTFFTWLGVVPYLTGEAIAATLGFIAGLPGGGEVVFDYGEPAAVLSAEQAAAQKERAEAVAALGEPFLSYFDPPALHRDLRAHGFATVEDLSVLGLARRFLGPEAADAMAARGARDRGGHVLFAAT